MLYDIATCTRRNQKKYKNGTTTWEAFAQRLATPTRTGETMEEYRAASKAERGRVKDTGGFVAGYLGHGLRTEVVHRSMICLDIDNAGVDAGVWDIWRIAYGTAAAMYSTHSHTPERPRFRLIIPLSRVVDADEYEAIGRKIAETVGIELFDPTTFEPQRMMYWPSCSKDAPYVFEHCDGEPLNPDEVLSQYVDWRDVSAWPTSKVSETLRKASEKKAMQAIADKKGPVGVFCRVYDIHAAIAKFVPAYVRNEADPARYTYSEGSTSNGVVTYDDTFSYSHHATDPASGREVNSFDLVRLHRFHDLDEDVDLDTAPTKLPSYKAMCQLVAADDLCKLETAREEEARVMEAEAEFSEEPAASEEKAAASSEWTKKIQRDQNNKILPNYHNIELIFSHDPRFTGLFGYDAFVRRIVLLKSPPWRTITREDRAIKDSDDSHIRAWFDKRYQIQGKDKIFDGVLIEAEKHTFHPVKDYLEGLVWDGEPRLETVLIDYFGCEDSEYMRAITRKTLLGAVKRIYEPGCQFDTMLTLKGPQGCGKSSFFRKLSRGWFSDSLKDIRTKDALEGLQGAWIVEMSEMSALKKSDAEGIKSFLSGTTDRFRAAYGRRTEDYPRQNIFVATTNEPGFLRDRTGNRRFWIASIPKGGKPKKDVFTVSDEEIGQIWAEAFALYKAGTETVMLSRDLEAEAIKVQETFMQEDPRAEAITAYLDIPLPDAATWRSYSDDERQEYIRHSERHEAEGVRLRDRTCAAEIWMEALGHDDASDMSRYDAVEINQIVDGLPNWERNPKTLRFPSGITSKGFVRVKGKM